MPYITASETLPPTPPAATVVGDYLTLSCGRCAHAVLGVALTSVRRHLPLVSFIPGEQVAARVATFCAAAGVAVVCARCNGGV